MSSSYEDWLKKVQNGEVGSDDDWEQEQEEVEEAAAKEAQIAKDSEISPKNESLESIKKLCRVCSSNGLININAMERRTRLQLKKPFWSPTVTIAEMIQEISGEKVNALCTLFKVNQARHSFFRLHPMTFCLSTSVITV